MGSNSRGDGEVAGLLIVAVIFAIGYLLWVGGKKVYEDWRGSADAGSTNCRLYAEYICYKFPHENMPYEECVTKTLGIFGPDAWCREALAREHEK